MLRILFDEIGFNNWLSSDNVIIEQDVYNIDYVNNEILYMFCKYLRYSKNDGYIYTIKVNVTDCSIYAIKTHNNNHIENHIFRYGRCILIENILYVFEKNDNILILERLKKIQKLKQVKNLCI